jgi:hypothetical protein
MRRTDPAQHAADRLKTSSHAASPSGQPSNNRVLPQPASARLRRARELLRRDVSKIDQRARLLALLRELGDGRWCRALDLALERVVRDVRHSKRRFALMLGKAGVAGGFGATETRAGTLPSFQGSPSLAWLDRPQQLAAPPNGAGLDAIRELPQFVVVGLLRGA